jgi:glycosyltransferase involved in cell wall biosynthesis
MILTVGFDKSTLFSLHLFSFRENVSSNFKTLTMEKSKFCLSVIIPTYNRSQMLDYTLHSLCRQDIDKDDFEVIIADDGSDDDTFQLVKKYKDLLHLKFAHQEDKGYRPASARNMGIKIAEGELCVFFDSGMILRSDCLREHQIFHMQRGKDIALIGYIYGFSQDGEREEDLTVMANVHCADETMENLDEAQKFLDIRDRIFRKYDDHIEHLPVPWTLFWGGHLSVSRKNLIEVELFDEGYNGNWGCEDNDLGYRLLLKNKSICFSRKIMALHLPHGINLELKKEQGYANCLYFHNKFRTPATKLFLQTYLKEITGNEVIDFNELMQADVSILV